MAQGGISVLNIEAGDVVNYSDMANDSTYMVVEVTDCQWSPFKLVNVETFEKATTDGRQFGWSLVRKYNA